ncbi:hypothetical protein [Undibacterium sp.]|jgi:hypothetical protein|uniref:hypothetical protein n=1 Tax=Undibacterium sp. TaxID=1914977 RepID=UPI002CF2CB46|nr:hypothetical protein [Undibacterium sp.]HTD05199.1 hypothetical protein [Undibacterium sp.]
MNKIFVVIIAGLMFGSNAANAAGCIKGAAVGAVAGHVAGHHAVLGAVGGCVVGHHLAKQKAKEEKEAARAKKEQTTAQK